MLEIKRSTTKHFSLDINNNGTITTEDWIPKDLENIDQIKIYGVFQLVSAEKRIELLEWAYKVLAPGGKVLIQVPCWYHGRSYTDPGVVWPPICAESFMLSNKGFREANMPHVEMNCNFDVNAAFGFDQNDVFVAFRNQETQATLLGRNINTCTDFHIVLTKI